MLSFITPPTPLLLLFPTDNITATLPNIKFKSKPFFTAATARRRRNLCSNSIVNHTQPTQTTHSLIFHYQEICYDDHSWFFMLEHEDDDSFENGVLVNPRFTSFTFPRNLDFSSILGSSNGLLCLAHDHHINDPIIVCNPLTGEYVTLPKAECASEIVSGFGFDHVANQYKVIRLSSSYLDSEFSTEVYTLGSGDWRKKTEYAPYRPPSFIEGQVFVNGALHWLIPEHSLIMPFHLSTEDFQRPIPIPPHLTSRLDKICLQELGGYLCLVNFFRNREEIWVMKEYGVKDSWTREWVIPGKELIYKFVKLMKNGNILIHGETSKSQHLSCFDPVTETSHNLGIAKAPIDRWCSVTTHARSFASLKDIAGITNGIWPQFAVVVELVRI